MSRITDTPHMIIGASRGDISWFNNQGITLLDRNMDYEQWTQETASSRTFARETVFDKVVEEEGLSNEEIAEYKFYLELCGQAQEFWDDIARHKQNNELSWKDRVRRVNLLKEQGGNHE